MDPSLSNQASPASADTSVKRRGGGSRSRTGCWTCRTKKVKCDETRPLCRRCSRLRLLCRYDQQSTTRPQEHGFAVSNQLPQFANSASSLDLSPADHEAIRYFRTTFARLHHTKNPDFSVYSIMFAIAESQPLVMRMLLAVGGREMESRRPAAQDCLISTPSRKSVAWAPLQHYATSLRSLADTLPVGSQAQGLLDLDASFTLIYLMIQYEQKHGDDERLGLQNHLKGAAAILSRRCANIREQLAVLTMSDPPALASKDSGPESRLSLYSARMLIWISISDATASTYGIGGAFNDTLHGLLGCSEPRALLHTGAAGVEDLHAYSNPLFRVMWGTLYPQEELLDDVENRSVFELLVCCYQMRHLLAKVKDSTSNDERQARLDATAASMQAITTRYSELLQVAGGLYPSTGSSVRLVRNLRTVAPHYHAVVVLFARFSRGVTDAKSMIDPLTHCGSIIGLAKQSFRHGGDEAVMPVAWPLLVVALEAGNESQRDWILNRFRGMARFNANFAHAYELLQNHTMVQSGDDTDPWLNPRARFRSPAGKLFVF